jgi:hypothetical protein
MHLFTTLSNQSTLCVIEITAAYWKETLSFAKHKVYNRDHSNLMEREPKSYEAVVPQLG